MITYYRHLTDEPIWDDTHRRAVAGLVLPPLTWIAEDVFIIVVPEPGFDVAELERRSSSPDEPPVVLDHAEFLHIMASTEQLIDGEFVGYSTNAAGELDEPVIRFDMLDGSMWTVTLDPDRVRVLDDFEQAFGPGEAVASMTTRADERHQERQRHRRLAPGLRAPAVPVVPAVRRPVPRTLTTVDATNTGTNNAPMLTHTRPITRAAFDELAFPRVFANLRTPALDWLVTDLYLTATASSTINVSDWESKVTESGAFGLWITHDEMLLLVRSTDQLMDGEFFGFAVTDDPRSAFRPVLRLDVFDSGQVTVTFDTRVVTPTPEFVSVFGSGTPVDTIGDRASDTAALDATARTPVHAAGTHLPDQISAADMHALLAASPAVAADVVAVVSRMPSTTAFDVTPFDAAEFDRVVRRSYADRSPDLLTLIAPLAGRGDAPILFCQGDLGDVLVSVLLRAADRSVLAAIAHDRALDARWIAVAEVIRLLRSSADALAARAIELLSTRDPDTRLRLAEQGGLSTARTLHTKFTLARERGFTADGLESFVAALAHRGEATIQFITHSEGTEVAYVAMDADQRMVIAVMIIGGLRPHATT